MDPILLIAIYFTLAVVLRKMFPNRLTTALLVIVSLCSTFIIYRNHRVQLADAWSQGTSFLAASIGMERGSAWPPELGKVYPTIHMVDQNGDFTSLEEFRGKVVLVHLVGMSCPACVALSGGELYGGFGTTMSQPGIHSIDNYVEQFAGIHLDHPDLVVLQILLFNPQLQPTGAKDAQIWAYHFRQERDKGRVVLAGSERLMGKASIKMVPGFQLLDRNLVLRADSCGSSPTHNLYEELIPLIPALLNSSGEESAE